MKYVLYISSIESAWEVLSMMVCALLTCKQKINHDYGTIRQQIGNRKIGIHLYLNIIVTLSIRNTPTLW